MGVALVFWGRFRDAQGNKITIPAPTTDPGAPWLWDDIAASAAELQSVGFTAVQFPPHTKVQGGAYAGCDGYGVFDPRDQGDKLQQGGKPTRYGSLDSLRKAVAVLHANGLQAYLDIVLHQRIGENGGPGVFKYVGADGRTMNGRGRTAPGWFRGGTGNNDPIPPFCAEDDVPNRFFDYPFGRELSYQNCNPHRVTIDDAIDWGDMAFRTTGADGARIDDVKGTWAPFVREFLTSRAMVGKHAYAEFFDGNPRVLDQWVFGQMGGRCGVEDFEMHFHLQDFCNGGSAHRLDGAGYAASQPYLATTWVENPDTDLSPGQGIINNKMLAYAFIMTVEGYPFVYGKDYFPSSKWPGAYGLKPLIDNLVWIHERLASGRTATRFVDDRVIVLERLGPPGLLTAISNDPISSHTITCQTTFGPSTHLHDYTGHHPDIWTDGSGMVTFTVPSNYYGQGNSYLCFSQAGISADFPVHGRETTQLFMGADDLALPAGRNGSAMLGRITVAAASAITSRAFTYDHIPGAQILTYWVDKAGKAVIGYAPDAGEYEVHAVFSGFPPEGAKFEVEVTYMAPRLPAVA
jgi:alpha-amylase